MNIELALSWAQQGHRVLPVKPAFKRPLIKAWQEHCTTSEVVIYRWWQDNPNAQVGIATGAPGFDVLDFDVAGGKPGAEQLIKLMDMGILTEGTFRIVATPSGGRHLYFKGSDQRNKQNEKTIPGVDFRAQGGMVLAAGNPGYRYISGAGIAYEDLAPVDWDKIRAALAPDEIPPTTGPAAPPRPWPGLAGTHAPPPPPVPSGRPREARTRLVAPARNFDDPAGEESPLDWYTHNHDLEALLSMAGWQFDQERQGRRDWVRPGKKRSEGVSGNVATMPDGRRVFFNFSSSVDLPVNTALSTAQLYAHLYHGGDMKTAAREIRRTMMPVRPRAAPAAPRANGAAPAGMHVPPAPAQPSGGALVPAREADLPDRIRGFWQARPELREMWFQATETGYSPWAVLGYALAMVAVRVGPHVVLPPRTRNYGGPASLNLFVAIVGDTGDGKDEAAKLARPFVGTPHVASTKPGTGQGIAALFTEQTKDGPVQVNDTAYLHHSEVSGLGAHADMQGSNLVDTLLSVYMAQELGEHYANKEKRRPVREHAYRLAMTVGVQPSNAHILLDEERAASGLPQRFIWMPATWPDSILDSDSLRIPAPGPYVPVWRAESWVLPGSLDDSIDASGWSPADAATKLTSPKKASKEELPVPVKEQVMMTYDDAVWTEINRITRERLRTRKAAKLAGERMAGAADAHLTLTRLKIASVLALWLDRSTHVAWEMWELAWCILWISNQTRIEAQNELGKKKADVVAGRAAARTAQDAIVKANQDAGHDAMVTRTATRLRHLLGVKAGEDGWVPLRDLNRGMSSKEKREMREAGVDVAEVLDDLILLGVVESRDPEGSEQGARYRIPK